MNLDQSVIDLILDASLIVKLVMLSLAAFSLISWAMILEKRNELKRARHNAEKFEDRFRGTEDLGRLFNHISRSRRKRFGMEKIFESGYQESQRIGREGKDHAGSLINDTERAMRVAMNEETDSLETRLSFLATVGSTSPYVGLLGTVWGIMNSFQSLGNVRQATIAMVAPGISEALIATAMGLVAAIPAVIAYNHFSREVERLSNRYLSFLEECSAALHHHRQGKG